MVANILRIISRVILEFVAAVALAYGLLAIGNEWFSWALDFRTMAVITGVAAIAYVFLLRWVAKRPDGERSLKLNTPGTSRYYTNWYGRVGELHIFCSDTEWWEHETMRPVVDQIRKKGARAHLYLRKTSGPVVDELRKADVQIFAIPDQVAVNFKMSVLINGDHREAIIRNKLITQRRFQRETHSFKESADPYLLSFIIDTLQRIRAETGARQA